MSVTSFSSRNSSSSKAPNSTSASFQGFSDGGPPIMLQNSGAATPGDTSPTLALVYTGKRELSGLSITQGRERSTTVGSKGLLLDIMSHGQKHTRLGMSSVTPSHVAHPRSATSSAMRRSITLEIF